MTQNEKQNILEKTDSIRFDISFRKYSVLIRQRKGLLCRYYFAVKNSPFRFGQERIRSKLLSGFDADRKSLRSKTEKNKAIRRNT